MANEKITIKDVAAASGVSTGTVSRVLNSRPGVKPYTREKVWEVMKRLNYQPDLAARELTRQKGKTIGLSLWALFRKYLPFHLYLMEHLVDEIEARGFRFHEIPNGPDGLPCRLSEGMVLLGAHDDDPRIPYLREKKVPAVIIGRSAGISGVKPDDFDGGYQATRHLIRLGHRKIVFIGGQFHTQVFGERYAGHRRALEEAGLPVCPEYLLDGDFSSLEAYRALSRFQKRELQFSAVFAASDEMAIGAMAALEDSGLKVPVEASVIGYDDLGDYSQILTTIHQDIPLLARTAIELLIEQLEGKPVRSVVLPIQLIARRTTARQRDL